MLDEPLRFYAKAPLSAWNQRLGVDYPGVFKALLKAALAAATANVPGAISAAINGFFAFKVEDAKRPPEELAWLLIRRALAHAMAKLAVEALKQHDRDPDDAEGLVARLDAALDAAEIPIDQAFAERPADHPIVATTCGPFQEWLSAYGLNDAETRSVTRRLGAYFTLALHREWSEHADDYRTLEAKLLDADTPFARATALERAWLRNTAYLQRLIREPVFVEPFGLHDVYVPLRAYYVEETTDEVDLRLVRSDRAPTKQRNVAVDLRAECLRWLKADDRRDAVRLIAGDPGCGKTSFAKELAAELADAWPEDAAGLRRRVLFVPLHRFNFTGDLQITLRQYLAVTGILPADFDPLDGTTGVPRLLIFFDGLDEISEQGRPGRDAIQRFAGQIDVLARTLNQASPRVFFVLGGRELSVSVSRQHFQRPRQVLHVLPYFYFLRDADDDPADPDTGPIPVDLRDLWWQKYATAKGKNYASLPKSVDRPDLVPITSQPLLNYLLAQSLERGQLDFSTELSLNEIYGDLLLAVYERHWGDPEQIPPARDRRAKIPRPGHPALLPLAWEDFVELLEQIALLAWHGAGRTVRADAVQKVCEDLRLKDRLDAFTHGAEAGAASLLVSFFFRQAVRIGGEPTFEFTHKSFGEYLAARGLVRAMVEIQDNRADRAKRRRPWSEEMILADWCRLTGPAALDPDLLAFLRREVALAAKAEPAGQTVVEAWRQNFADLLSYELHNGLPMHALELGRFQEMVRQARNAEEALYATLHACTSVTPESSPIDWPSATSYGELLSRLQGQRGVGNTVLEFLTLLHAPGQRFDCANLMMADLRRANLAQASLVLAILFEADLEEANLQGAVLFFANLQQANLQTANLQGANLEGANLVRANLIRANLEGANLEGANLQRAALLGANLEGANLVGANLQRAALLGANLEGANLEWANLQRADLVGANLEGVNLEWANLERANLEHVRISRKWVTRLGLNVKRLRLDVVEEL